MVVAKNVNGEIFTADSVKKMMFEIGLEYTDGKRRAFSNTQERGSWYKGYQVIFQSKYIIEEFDNYEHQQSYSSQADLREFAKTFVPKGCIVLGAKGRYTGAVANETIMVDGEPVRQYKKRADSSGEIIIAYMGKDQSIEVTYAVTDEDGFYVNPDIKELEEIEMNKSVTEVEAKKPVHKEGKKEVKPKFTRKGTDFVIHCNGRKSIELTLDFVRDFTKRYTIDKLTINQMAIKFELLREEVIIIKTAFGLTKDSIPYIDEDIDMMTVDEMAEDTRIEKKRAFQSKLHNKKFADIEKEMKRLHEKEFVLNTVLDAVRDMDLREVENYGTYIARGGDKVLVVPLTDIHVGMESKNMFNTFNFEIAMKRVRGLAERIVAIARKNSGLKKIVIEGLGDTIHGEIHGNQKKENEFEIPYQITNSIKFFRELITILLKETNVPVEMLLVEGNHDRINKQKDENSQHDSYHIVIREVIRDMFSYQSQFKMLEEASHNLVLVEVDNYYLACHHGHEGKNANKIITSMVNHGKRILEIHKGHFHQKKELSMGYVTEITFPSFCGVDSYAETNAFSGEAFVEMRMYDSTGCIATLKHRFEK